MKNWEDFLLSYAFTRLIIGTALKSIIKDINKMKQKPKEIIDSYS